MCQNSPTGLGKSACRLRFDAASTAIQNAGSVKFGSCQNNPRRWSKATGPISATTCSVPEVGWKPVTPGIGRRQKLTRFWMARFSIKRRLLTISQETSSCKCGEKSLSTRPASAWIMQSSPIFPGKSALKFIKERNFLAVSALNFLVCGAVKDPFVPAKRLV